nr:MAG TPA: hypothetical protein [Caudoviricetes sp.]
MSFEHLVVKSRSNDYYFTSLNIIHAVVIIFRYEPRHHCSGKNPF